MSHYIHHVPGRLRVKMLQLKRNEAKAAEVCKLLACTDGVSNCEVKTLTGSVVISYDADLTNSKKLVSLLKEHGYIAEIATVDNGKSDQRMANTVGAVTENVGKALLGFAVERSTVALIGAIL